MSGRFAVLFAAAGLLAGDQVLKALLGRPLPTPATTASIVGGLLVLALLGCGAYFLGWRRRKEPTFLAASLLCAGSASNLLDRLLRGSVFVYLPGLGGRGVNLADIAIVLGTLFSAILLGMRFTGWLRGRARSRPGT
jgi:hypothetical protein